MTADDAARIAANHDTQRRQLLARAELLRTIVTPAEDLDAEERWHALHDGWVGGH